jgi:DNA-directed RNA polymerase specialized sigma24 family protein
MKKSQSNQGPKKYVVPSRISACFASLPPLGTQSYIRHVQTADKDELPPEVLAQAFRQLPPDSDASRETLNRLLRRDDEGKWEYLGALFSYARRKNSVDAYEDAVQDALRRILQVIGTPRGKLAEVAWNSFCIREFIEAWRERFGRRGERRVTEVPLPDDNTDDDELQPRRLKNRFPHLRFERSQVERIEDTALKILAELPNDFMRAVASRAWFRDERPKQSGKASQKAGSEPMTSMFPDKSRFQIRRAERYADSQLAAALLADPLLEAGPDWHPVLEELRVQAPQPPRRAKERTS